ncbi:gas vesicle protein K [Actinacidiphila guanduensis]|uniref:Gas vesicle protein K n=1 Tax=Actinacidiphila guanduensis TaxID=310781 RepID=A0A1H0NIN0_9ACTN|nr:gas vesicle protein K [Actinacidiphila guanduensis]SDO92627.1 Gas vesicle protein K [Actinacidiphila guanduensis]
MTDDGREARRERGGRGPGQERDGRGPGPEQPPEPRGGAADPAERWNELADAADRAFRLLPAPPEDDSAKGRPDRPARRVVADPDTVERDLVRLVLTLVELLRQLMERQALRRVDAGDLSEEQEERLGTTLMLLHDRMTTLCARYDLTMEDLNLDLGPLGPLLPPEP